MDEQHEGSIYLVIARTLKQEVRRLACIHELEQEAVLRGLLARSHRAPWAVCAYGRLPDVLARAVPFEQRAHANQLLNGILELILVETLSKTRHPDRPSIDWFDLLFGTRTTWRSLSTPLPESEAKNVR